MPLRKKNMGMAVFLSDLLPPLSSLGSNDGSHPAVLLSPSPYSLLFPTPTIAVSAASHLERREGTKSHRRPTPPWATFAYAVVSLLSLEALPPSPARLGFGFRKVRAFLLDSPGITWSPRRRQQRAPAKILLVFRFSCAGLWSHSSYPNPICTGSWGLICVPNFANIPN